MRRLIPVLIVLLFLFSCGVSKKECLKRGCTWVCREKGEREYEIYGLTPAGEMYCLTRDIIRVLTPRCKCVCPKEKEKEEQKEPGYPVP